MGRSHEVCYNMERVFLLDTYGDVDKVDKIFMCLFHFNLGIVNPNVRNAYKHEYSLEQILSSDVYYKQFCDYWLKQYNYDDLFKLVYDVSVFLASDRKPMPDELIEIILYYAFV